ncbi:hypothetical protein OIE13_06155 [Streptosporangium sp. NBC_01810]|uniref:hypothetical protein n=1 Tax=Streptosporangium sp. NBC_01810 TaxID=2975951 RepID=UPI002DDAAF72|nr:hypothetical protein [Streptosporangium sp. NBC_01810]WSA27457.1 hypothetical protein OIE13_06155 [Streptosporangium sp. NBC_01810]
MTHIDDLYEPYDDREPEPPEEHEQPLDLDELAATLADARNDPGELGQATAEVLAAVPHLLARLRAAEAELEDWRNRTHRYEYGTTLGPLPGTSGEPFWPVSRDQAELAWQQTGLTPWVRTISTSDWAELTEPPF